MQATKFYFETTFDDEFLENQRLAEEAVMEEVEPPPPTFSEEELAACRADALAEGHAAGLAEAEAGISRVAAGALQAIESEIGNLATLQSASSEEIHRDALSLAAAIVRKTIPDFALETAAPLIESFVRESLTQFMEEPRIVIRISDSLLDRIKEDIEQIGVRSGYPGQMIVLADGELSPQDCRIEWADGGAERNSERVWQQIDETVARFLESRAPADAELSGNTELPNNPDNELDTELDTELDNDETIEMPTPECVS